MAVTVNKITLWRGKIDNRPGTLAAVLEPFAQAKVDLEILMGYREPGESQAVVELYPVSGARASAAAQRGGLGPARGTSLLISGDNRTGVGHRIARALAEAGINLNFLVAQATGRKFSMVAGFDSETDATRASALVKKAAKG